jgi:hypothetical protein
MVEQSDKSRCSPTRRPGKGSLVDRPENKRVGDAKLCGGDGMRRKTRGGPSGRIMWKTVEAPVQRWEGLKGPVLTRPGRCDGSSGWEGQEGLQPLEAAHGSDSEIGVNISH